MDIISQLSTGTSAWGLSQKDLLLTKGGGLATDLRTPSPNSSIVNKRVNANLISYFPLAFDRNRRIIEIRLIGSKGVKGSNVERVHRIIHVKLGYSRNVKGGRLMQLKPNLRQGFPLEGCPNGFMLSTSGFNT